VIAESPSVVKVTNISRLPWSGQRWRIAPGETIEVPWEFLTAFGGSSSLHFDLSEARDMLAVRNAEGRLMFDFWLPLSTHDGYGHHATSIYEAMVKLGVAPVLRETPWDGIKPRHLERLAAENKSRLPSRIGLIMSVPYDPMLTSHESVFKLVITQFETNRIPEAHVKAVNKADHLITTSHFQPEVWRRSGLRKSLPISVLTPGIDTDFFTYRRRQPDGLFKVLMLGALTGRKDPFAAIKMFQVASHGDPDWRFTIKTRLAVGTDQVMKGLGLPVRYKGTGDHREMVFDQPFRGVSPLDNRIEMIISSDPPAAVRDYYHNHDCLLWPSKGEGVGLPPLEAMACGMEVVMANNSGMADYAFPEHCWPIPTSHMESAQGEGGFSHTYTKAYGSVGEWWVPSEKEGIKQLRRAHDAWKAGQGKGVAAANYVRTHHTLELQARSVLKIVEKYAG
jgi:glycosyltransferase involved in cell wall biosynthesis